VVKVGEVWVEQKL
jgi:hypothetical protein